jgi:hypothetical protein
MGLNNSEKFGKPDLINLTRYYQPLKNRKNDERREIPQGGEKRFAI